jgi:putative tryptophan/tyrosine transport system substrate-binding protein
MGHVRRRQFLISAGSLLVEPLVCVAQQRGKVVRIGFVAASTAYGNESIAVFRDELRKLGWLEGQNVVIEPRNATGDTRQFAPLIEELLRLKVDVLVTTSTPAALAAKSATSEIPVVFSMVSDPVASGIVASLSRPGGNLTGWSNMLAETSSKLLELLREVIPKASRFVVLFDPSNAGKLLDLKVLQAAAQRSGLTLRLAEVRNPADINAAFAAMARERPDGVIVLQDAVSGSNRKEIVDSATNARLPTIYQVSDFVDLGGLLSYGVNMPRQFRRSAVYVDKILRGARPSDLPVEQPTAFELVINLKAAKALGVVIPQSTLLRADRVIQ